MVLIRKYFLRKKIKDFLAHNKAAQHVLGRIRAGEHGDVAGAANGTTKPKASSGRWGSSKDIQQPASNLRQRNDRQASQRSRGLSSTQVIRERDEVYKAGLGGFPAPWQLPAVRKLFRHPSLPGRSPLEQEHHYLSFEPTLDHRGRFQSLSGKESEELGGVEYRSLQLLLWLLPVYVLFWTLLPTVILVPYAYRHTISTILKSKQPGNLDPGW